jgi:hypothetical protein
MFYELVFIYYANYAQSVGIIVRWRLFVGVRLFHFRNYSMDFKQIP